MCLPVQPHSAALYNAFLHFNVNRRIYLVRTALQRRATTSHIQRQGSYVEI